ncbi:hypothetical protein [Oribacterium sp. FC2011]|uniref:hypothetical protein n=1 Tax=Oribacterium sp. FC2011 TaxID=1408311 RepID=UPI0004E14827|nr:hypothetical protein [Oribacterium sp. FC2011]
MSEKEFKLSDDPKDLEVAVEWVAEKRKRISRQRKVRDDAKRRLKPLLDEAAKKKAERLNGTT